MKQDKVLVIILFAFWSITNVTAQKSNLYMPSEIKKAYDNGTRSYDGKPGSKYWQNFVDYSIKVNIIPAQRLIDGHEKVVLKNSSPDKINSLVVRLYADVFKKGNSRASRVDERDVDNGVELSEVMIDGQKIDLKDRRLVRRQGTNISFTLPKPLEPGKELSFEASWKQKIPFTNMRTGVTDSVTFFVGYWYPQIAVYDDIFGWDRLDYTLQTEFYNNLGSYDVEITVPHDFTVWATGTLINAEKVLPKSIYDKYIQAKSSQEVVHVLSKDDRKNGFKTLENIWHYTANEVSDFAFGLSNHYLWDACKQTIDGRNVLISSAYPVERADECKDLTAVQQKSMKFQSENVPGIAYPYECFTTFIGSEGGGMEYPMMANNGGPNSGVTIHEMFHTYFPMYVRINERRWAWMDEGWATYNTSVIENWYFNDKKDIENLFSDSKSMQGTMGTLADLPLITSSEYLVDNYGYASYPLPAFVYALIHQHLGDEMFFKCYIEYIKRWAKKSPCPYDFFYTFENVSGQDLSWVWKPWFFEFGVPDLGIQSFVKDKLIISNKGTKPVPLFVNIEYENGEKKSINNSAKIWADRKNSFELKIPDYKKVKRIAINNKVVDVNELDNHFPSVKEITQQANVSEKLFGLYKTSQFPAEIKLIKIEGLIYLSIAEYGIKDLLYPVEKLNLNTLDNTRKLEFKLNEANEITGFTIDWNGYKFAAEKIK